MMLARGPAARRRMRWAVPAAAVVAVAAVIAGTAAAGAQSAPSLPARTPAQLIAGLARARPIPLTGTITETASLGLPALPSGDSPGPASPLSGLSLLSGTHTFMLWYADNQHVRIAEPVQLGESDLRRDGRQVWLWDSTTQTATHLTLPGHLVPPAHRVPRARALPSGHPAATPATPPTPQQAARQILAAIGPTTTVSVQPAVTVAGQAAYQLGLAPTASGSLIGRVTVAIDAANSLPLRVQVFARGAATPALSIGFTALSFGRPAASNFTFTPPPGATVKTATLPAPGFRGFRPGDGAPPGQGIVLVPGSGSGPAGGIVLVPGPGTRPATRPGPGTAQGSGGLPGAGTAPGSVTMPVPAGAMGTATPPAPVIPTLAGPGPRSRPRIIKPVPAGPGAIQPGAAGPGARPSVMGTGWLSVLVIPAPAAAPSGVTAVYSGGGHFVTFTAATPAPGTSPGASSGVSVLRELLKAATPVHGAWGSGHLLRTSLLSVLQTSNGTLLIGAVTPAVLFADAAGLR
jgi:hypothetical protein